MFTFEDAIRFAFNYESILELPKSISENCSMVIDLNSFQLDDVLKDDNGQYKPYGNKTLFYEIKNEDSELKISQVNKKIDNSEHVFKIYRVYYKSEVNTAFTRKTIRITNLENQKIFDKIVVGYEWNKKTELEDRFLQLKPHGNAKKSQTPYVRLTKNCLEKIKEESINCESASINYARSIKDSKNKSQSELPRSIQQYYFYKSKQLSSRSKNVKTNDDL